MYTFFPRGSEVPFEFQRVMAVEVFQNEISGGRKNKGGEKVGSVIHQRRANRRTINIKEKKQGEVV